MTKILPSQAASTAIESPNFRQHCSLSFYKTYFSIVVLNILFVSIVACILALASLLVPPMIVFAIIATIGFFLICAILLLICRDRLIKKTPKEPPLLPSITPTAPPQDIKNLKACLTTTPSHLHKYKLDGEENFFPNFDTWKEVFLKDPDFLLKSILSSWTQEETSEGIVLTHPNINFHIFLSLNSHKDLQQALTTEIKDIVFRTYCEQIVDTDLPPDNKANPCEILRYSKQKDLENHDYFVMSSNSEILEHSTTPQHSLFKMFRQQFLLYYTALLHNSQSQQFLVIKPLTRGSAHKNVRQLEWLAFFSAIEQIQYGEDISQILFPEDYWKHFVEKNYYYRNLSPLALLKKSYYPESNSQDISLEILAISDMNTEAEEELLSTIKTYCQSKQGTNQQQSPTNS
ncbi:hypothetical protein [Chlamydia sp. 17-3921]|uniref:hypothetical protein n=1 Tax=Chlamydia sp. 17-3921 TaxID=2675798 RepID=UPI001917E2B0|nr:hypothetical protein [Chlamydia sp. 17-3921]